MKKIYFILFLLLFPSSAWSVPSNTMSITPAAVDATVISASDENTRNNETSTKFNAHDHNDIDQVGNTLSVGDATAGNKTIQANNADASKPYIRFDDTNNRWVISQDGSETSTIVTLTGSTIAYYYLPSSPAGINGQTIGLSLGVLSFMGMNTTGDLEVHNGTTRVRLVPAQIGTTVVSQGAGTVPIFDFASKYYIGTFSYDTTTTGSVSVTGVGFKPRAIIALAGINGVAGASVGFYDSSSYGNLQDGHVDTASTWLMGTAELLTITPSAATNSKITIASFDTDGFTYTKAKTGSPSGTAIVVFMCIR